MSWPQGTGPELPPGAYVLALSCLPGAAPQWARQLVEAYGPVEAWRQVVSGKLQPKRVAARGLAGWEAAVAGTDVAALWQRCLGAGITVLWPGGPGYPPSLELGRPPGGPLFVLGDPKALSGAPMVAVVGTRRCTPEGLLVAYELGRDLAAAGVGVVSGLALGIDGAAHSGALAARRPSQAPTVGVAASGVDVVYPRRHRALWSEVARWGAVVSETAPGSPAQAWRFPARNRIIAGLARIVVVVESHLRGGSWHTVDAALEAGKEVAAFPGPVRSPASAGTNRLLATGAAVVTSAEDVLALLDATTARPPMTPAPRRTSAPPLGDVAEPSWRTPGRRPAAGLTGGPTEETPLPGLGGGQRSSGTPGGRLQPRPGPTTPDRGARRPDNPLASALLAALPARPACLDELVERSRLPVGAALLALDDLERAGLVTEDSGWWWRSR